MTDNTGFEAWVGKADVPPADTITPRLTASFAATFAPHLADVEGAPPGIHWCLAPPTVPAQGLGNDGHVLKGEFWPPIPLPRRMWASSEIEFIDALQPHDQVTRSSRIDDITSKTGRSGELYFVTVDNTYETQRGPALREQQHIVYRAAASGPAPQPAPAEPAPSFDSKWQVDVNSIMLFRYSALSFNAHRIHYDSAYARETEFYDDLVIHGPLQATLLLNLASGAGEGLPRRFSFRGVAPATGAQTLTIGATHAPSAMDLKVVSSSGVITMTANSRMVSRVADTQI